MIKLAVTDVDRHQRYLNVPNYSYEDYVRDLLRLSPKTKFMGAGIAFHSILEHVRPEQLPLHDVYTKLPDEFGDKVFRFIFHADCELPFHDIHEKETFLQKIYHVDDEDVIVRGRVDAIDSSGVVWDYKTSSRVDLESLESMYQWRLYLDMLDAYQFRYYVFLTKNIIDNERESLWDVLESTVTNQYRYPTMKDDIMEKITEFVVWLKENELDKHERFTYVDRTNMS